jgi:CHAD domain-containing protein
VRFFAGETLSEGLDRVIDSQFGIALGVATCSADEQASAVHETRKAIKRLRAMLRLVRDSISLDCYHTDNAALKLIAAELGAVRDSWVMAQILDRLLPHDHDLADSVATLVDRLQDRYKAESSAVLDNAAHMASILDQLENARKRAERWTIVAGEQSTPIPHAFATVEPGMQRVYKRGRRGMRIVADSPTDTLLHVWRKRAKYLRHQVEALNVLDPSGLGAMEVDLEQLTDALGDDHDLAVLLARIKDDPHLTDGINTDPIVGAICGKRRELQDYAITLGRRRFEDHSSVFLAYIQSIWGEGDTF